MSWTTRASTALILALAVATLPVVLDQCAASCEVHQPSATNGSQTTCHHAGALTPRMTQSPMPCGHDHHGTTVTIASNSVTPERGSMSMVAVVASPQRFELTITYQLVLPDSSPGSPLAAHDRSFSLRI